MAAQASAAPIPLPTRKTRYLPREHGATAMLLTPIVGVAILARSWHWSELAVLVTAFSAIAAKDPAVVLMRQRFVWRQRHVETTAAAQWFLSWSVLLAASAYVLFLTWPFRSFVFMGAGIVAFAAIAVFVNIRNRQRSTLFQIASAAALTSTSLATCWSAHGSIASWCWWFWLLIALQASTGILVVHARLEARIALRSNKPANPQFRRAACVLVGVLVSAAVGAVALQHGWIALALLTAASGYCFDLVRQRTPTELQRPLTSVGKRALTLSSLYSILLIAGLW